MRKCVRILAGLVAAFSFLGYQGICSAAKDNSFQDFQAHAAQVAAKGAIPVIVDTDIGNSTDDLFALDILYHNMDKHVVDIKGIVVSREGDGYAAIADIENTYYGHPNIPIGVERHGIKDSPIYIDYRGLAEMENPNGSKLFARTDVDFDDNLDGYLLYRKLLSEAPNHSVKIVGIGFVTSLVQLLESGPDSYSKLNGVDLVKKKVDGLYIMATKLGENKTDPGYNLRYDIENSQKFLELWPNSVPVYISPSPIGRKVNYPSEMVLSDLADVDIHPIKQVYATYETNTGQKMWDALSALNAIDNDLFDYSPWGKVMLSDDGKISFTALKKGNCVYQLAGSDDQSDAYLDIIRMTVK